MNNGHRARPLLLWGMMGVGKSELANYFREHMGVCAVDLDAMLSQIHGASIDELVNARGIDWFRAVERSLLTEVLNDGQTQVISVGGGTLLDESFRGWVRDRGYLCTLTATPDELLKRLNSSQTVRPLLISNKSSDVCEATFCRLLRERQGAYLDADCVIDTTHLSADAVAAEITPLFLCLEAA